jgi:hypothetical protein
MKSKKSNKNKKKLIYFNFILIINYFEYL